MSQSLHKHQRNILKTEILDSLHLFGQDNQNLLNYLYSMPDNLEKLKVFKPH